MKIKYKDIVGDLVPEIYSESCGYCCFHTNRVCIPYDAHQCVSTIFTESKSQIFEL